MKTRFMRIASVLTVLALVLSCGISSALAMYTSATTGTDSVTVAKWSIDVNGTEIANATAQTFTFDLFNTIYDSDGTAEETDVHEDLIAPGTSGSYEFIVTNNSEVTAKYVLTLTETNASDVPVEYSLDGQTWYASFDEINADADAFNDVVLAEGESQTVKVYWRWAFTVDADRDLADTLLGIAGQTAAPVVTILASLVATQVD